ncbi:hypothetical protein ACSLPA_33065, partial [Escherichia coli]
VRVVQPVMVIHQCLPGIDSRTVRSVVIGLEPFSARQLHIRDDRVHVVAALMAIGRELSELRDEVRKQGERDDS